jgi:hypothetical protein
LVLGTLLYFYGFTGIGIILGFFYIVAKDAIRRRVGT